MSRFEAWTLHLATLLVGGTGVVYAWMLYALAPSDPYSVIHHPLQPAVQHLHLWTAPLLVFGAGVIWRAHAWAHFRGGVRRRRPSGLTLLVTLAPMVVSGYLIQTAVGEGWRQAWVAIHLAASALWLTGHAAHAVAPLRAWLAPSSAGDRDDGRGYSRAELRMANGEWRMANEGTCSSGEISTASSPGDRDGQRRGENSARVGSGASLPP